MRDSSSPSRVVASSLGAMQRLHDGITHLSFWGAMLAVCYLTLVTAWEVIGRYVFKAPSGWAPDTAAVSFALVTFLSAPMLTWKGGHAAMTAVVNVLPAGGAKWLQRFTLLLAIVACGLCTWFGAIETVRLYERGVTMIAVTPIQKWWVMSAIVYGLGSITLYFIRHFLATFFATELPPQSEVA